MNQYHIYEKIGKGKHSVVYKGRKKKTIQYYAVKSVEKSQKSRVLQEVRTMHALDHRNILKFYAWYETSNHLWLILEYCVGGDLMSLLRQDVRLPEASIHDFGRDMVIALHYLHANSIIYCDIKPSNVLLDENGRLKLGGFGLSRRLSDINKNPINNLPPAKRGTPCYMAPELFSEGTTHSTSSDLWALGCVLYECATGRPPFMNTSFNQLAYEILNKDPAPISGASQEFSHLLYRLLDKNPATRIKWLELVAHPFWKTRLPLMELPPEPALEEFIRRHKLAPAGADEGDKAVRSLRESVDVMRLSRIAGNNLEKDGEGADYTAAQAAQDDIMIDNADAELDFEEAKEEEEEDTSTPALADDGSMIDQSGASAQGDTGCQVVGSLNSSTKMQPVQRRGQQQDQGQKLQASSGRLISEPLPSSSHPSSTNSGSSRDGEAGAPGGDQAAGAASCSGGGAAAAAAAGQVARKGSSTLRGASKSGLDAGTASTRGREEPASTAGTNAGSSASSSSSQPSTTGAPAAAEAGDTGAPGPLPQDGDSKQGATQIEELIWHPSDSAVKPIVANRRIERLPEPKFEPKALPFEPLTLQEMLNTDQKDLEAFLTQIYRAVASAIPLKDKINVLAYFETLCMDTNAANVLINSSLTVLFVRMLRNSRAPLLRVRLANVLGLLVRHATFISEELGSTQVVDILTEALRDKNERVRRRVMATLGELLFYIATQQQDSGVGSVQDVSTQWGITGNTIASIGRLLKPGEDETCQHYAVKTIENICSQGGDWACKFAVQDVLISLVGIYSSTRNDNLKATAASSLGRLLRSKSLLINVLLDKYGVSFLASGMASTSSKVQTSAVNMLNLALNHQQMPAALRGAIGEERQLVTSLINLLDHSVPLLRAKAILSVVLLCRLSTRWLMDCCKQKLLPSVERLLREERDAYTHDAVELLRLEMARAVGSICQSVAQELAGSQAGARASDSALQQLQVVQHLVSSPFFRAAVVTPDVVRHLASFLTITANKGLQQSGLSDCRSILIGVLEQISQQTELMTKHHQEFVGQLLPALCAIVASSRESGDARFFCLRMVSDLLATFLLDGDLYDPTLPLPKAGTQHSQQADGLVASTTALNVALQHHVLPLVPELLPQEDPMPLYALKLLGGVLEVNPHYVTHVEMLGLAPNFFEFLSLEHPNNNVHNIRLCRQLVSAGSMDNCELQRLHVGDKVTDVLVYAHQNNVEPFLEPVLDLSLAIIQRDTQDMKAGISKGELLSCFLQQLPVFMDLCTHADCPVAIAASQCLSQLVSMYPSETGCWLLSSDGAAVLAAALQGLHLEGTSSKPPSIMQKHLLSAVSAALSSELSLKQAAELDQLLGALREVQKSSEMDVRVAAGKAAERLGRLMKQQ